MDPEAPVPLLKETACAWVFHQWRQVITNPNIFHLSFNKWRFQKEAEHFTGLLGSAAFQDETENISFTRLLLNEYM